ncbi:hypothetical protein BDZ89DRAFT_71319 [Hymenopellis radicata]|nr:hypothetical protein BDZ89DRAFT_71319 [Hymenopellis radicata]
MLSIHFYTYIRWCYKQGKKPWGPFAYTIGVFLVELVETALTTQAVHEVVLQQRIPASFRQRAIPVSIVIGAVQCYFAWRITVLGRSLLFNFLAAFVTLLSVVQFAAALTFSITSFSDLSQIGNAGKVWSVAVILCDVVIAASLIHYRLLARTDTKDSRDTFIVQVLLTGSVTTLICVGHIVLAVCTRTVPLDVTLAYATGKLYSNLLLGDLSRGQSAGGSYVALNSMRNLSIGTISPLDVPAPNDARTGSYGGLVMDARIVSLAEGRIHTVAGPQAPALDREIIPPFEPPPTYYSNGANSRRKPISPSR